MKTLPAVTSALAVATTYLAGLASAIDLTVSKTGGNASSPLLYGIMFEVSIPFKWGDKWKLSYDCVVIVFLTSKE